jgi:hypothetical protein
MAFMKDFNMSLASDIVKPNCSYKYYHDTQQHFSTVDYFMVSEDVVDNSLQFSILDDVLNLSDHLPVSLKIAVPDFVTFPLKEHVHASPRQTAALRWDKANLAEYYALSYNRMQPLMHDLDEFYINHVTPVCNLYVNFNDEPVLLRSQLVNNRPAAINLIEQVYSKLIATLSDVAYATVPRIEWRTLKHWWNNNLRSLKLQAMESNQAWVGAGKPQTGLIAQTCKSDKYAYK